MNPVHWLESAAARVGLQLMRALGPVRASNLGGAVARAIGPILPVSRVADANLRLALPELDEAARRRVIRGVWDNLGRTAGEFPHNWQFEESVAGPGWEVRGAEHIADLVAGGGPGIMFTGHLANWELLPRAVTATGIRLATMYRPANNPLIDELIMDMRRASQGEQRDQLFPKGAQGARQMLVHLRRGGSVGLLLDQKMNDGIEARFFGHPAMTASALAVLALRLRCPVVPTVVQRLAPARFRVTYEPHLALPATGDRVRDVACLTQAVNDRLEAWVRACPESWLWLHRRWPKEFYAGL